MSTFPSIRIEGGILAPDLLDQLLAAELPGQRPADFGADAARSLTDTIAQAFEDARRLWDVFQRRLSRLTDNDPATSQTRDLWVNPFLSILGYEIRYNRSAYDVDGRGYAISHRAGEAEDAPPVHIVGARQELGRLDRVGRTHLAPHSLVQEFLNRTEHLWGIVTNGLTLRLLRDSTYIRRQAYVEFDLAAMLEEQRFQDFAALYRLLHRTRLPRGVGDAHECLLEQYYQHSVEQGGRVRERLRDGVEECLKRLANGFLRHSANGELRSRVTSTPGQGGSPPLTPEELYRQLLRLVYRFLFLLVSEDRGLISDDPIYLEHYGVARLRRLVDTRAAYTDHDDLWCSLRVLWKVLSDEKFAAYLHAAPLNGELFAEIYLDHCSISNRHLLEAFWHLVYYSETPSAPPRRVNYAALDVEELGSVYESLLELQPVIEANGEWGAGSWERGVANGVRFDFIQGGERKSTGSYYTPPELVAELVRSALDPVIRERLEEARRMASGERTANGERGAGRGERRQPSAVRGSPYLTEEEKRHVYRVLSRSGRLEQLHGARSSAVPAHEKLSQGGAFRDDVSDPPGRGISSGEYRGRMGTGHNRGVHPVPSRGSGQSEGVGNTSPAERESGPFDPGTDPTTARPVPGDRAATGEPSPQPYSEAAFLSLWHSTPLPTRYSLLAEHALLSIRVCDPAAGSGHFLLAAARRLGKELARVRTGEEEPAPERVREAIRDVVAHCIYGVDKNPLAVELCRVALWLEAHTPGKPLTFLDHRIKCGDSLVGVFDLGVLRQGIPDEAFTPLAGDDKAIASALKRRNREERRGQRSLPFDQGNDPLAGLAADARALDAIPDDTPAAVRRKKEHYDSIRHSQFAIRQVCDLWTAAFFQRMANEGRWMEKAITTRVVWDHLEGRAHPQAAAEAQLLAVQQRFFHWALEFPEVFAAEGEQGPASRERQHISNPLVSAPNSQLPIRRSPGFDVVLSNPPWERIKLQEQEFFAARDRTIANAPNKAARGELIRQLPKRNPSLYRQYAEALRASEAASAFLRNSGRFPRTGRGDINTYAVFAELARSLLRPGGRAGIIVPTGIATDDTTKFFFQDAVDRGALVSLYDFENRKGLFPGVHRSYKFCLLTMRGADAGGERGAASGREESAEFAFFAQSAEDLRQPERRFRLTPAEIALLNPNTRTCPIFRSQADAELTKAIYRRVPVLWRVGNGESEAESGEGTPSGSPSAIGNSPPAVRHSPFTLRRSPANPWGVSFCTMLHMANDSHLFRTAAELEKEGFRLVGNHFVKGDPHSPSAVRYLPLYEAKMLHQFDHRWATYETRAGSGARGADVRDVTDEEKADPDFVVQPRYWVLEDHVDAALPSDPQTGTKPRWLLGWRDITNATNERTLIAAALPCVAVGHTFQLLFSEAACYHAACLLGNLNSLVTDHCCRVKLGGTHLSYFVMRSIPILPPAVFDQPPPFPTAPANTLNHSLFPVPHSPLPAPHSLCAFIVPRVLELVYTAWDMKPFAEDVGYGGPPFAWDAERRFEIRCELDALFFHLYLRSEANGEWRAASREWGAVADETPEELEQLRSHFPTPRHAVEYILDQFPIVRRKDEERYGCYRTKQRILEIYDAMQEAMRTQVPWRSSLNPPPGTAA